MFDEADAEPTQADEGRATPRREVTAIKKAVSRARGRSNMTPKV
jgi:hypothetical protein